MKLENDELRACITIFNYKFISVNFKIMAVLNSWPVKFLKI